MENVASDATGSSVEMRLKGVNPHLLAVAMLQSVMEGDKAWRLTDAEVTATATGKFPMACEFYQLRIFLDLLTQRFGLGISHLVETSLVSVTNVSGINLLPKLMEAISNARALGAANEGPDNAKLRLDWQVANQALRIINESEEEKQQLRPLLAESLSYARIWAESIFPELVAKIEFAPESVAFIETETAYKGYTNRWRENPGCFERHLQRMESNPLFSEAQRHPTDEMITEARAKDDAELEIVLHDVKELFDDLKRMGEKERMPASTIADSMQYRIEPLMGRAAALGQSPAARRAVDALRQVMESMLEMLPTSPEQRKAFQNDWRRKTNVFIAQTWRDDTPIPKEDCVRALLCEKVLDVQEVLEIYQELDSELVDSMRKMAASFFEIAELDGFKVQGGKEKYDLFGCGVKDAATVAPVKPRPWWRVWS